MIMSTLSQIVTLLSTPTKTHLSETEEEEEEEETCGGKKLVNTTSVRPAEMCKFTFRLPSYRKLPLSHDEGRL